MAAAAPATEFAIPDMRHRDKLIVGLDMSRGKDQSAMVVGKWNPDRKQFEVIWADLRDYGQSFERHLPDGTVTRIDPMDVWLT